MQTGFSDGQKITGKIDIQEGVKQKNYMHES